MEALDGNIVIEEEVCGCGSKEDMHQCVIFGTIKHVKMTHPFFTVSASKVRVCSPDATSRSECVN